MAQMGTDGEPSRDDRLWGVIESFGQRAHKADVRKEALRQGIYTPHDLIDMGHQAIEDHIERLMRAKTGKDRLPRMIPTGANPGQYVFYEWANEEEMAFSIRMRSKQLLGNDVTLKKMRTDMIAKFGWAPEIPRVTFDGGQEDLPMDDLPDQD